MAFGERCPACGHMPGEEVEQARLDMTLAHAVDLTRASTTPGHTGEEIAGRVQLLYRAIKELTGAATPADPAP